MSLVLMCLSYYQWSKIINKKIRELQREETSLGQVMQMKILPRAQSAVLLQGAWLKIVQNNVKGAAQKVLVADKYRGLCVPQLSPKVA